MNLNLVGTPVPGADSPWQTSRMALRVVGGSTVTVATEFTRPANTTAYTAKDVVGPAVAAVLTFTGVGREVGGGGYITKARLLTNQSTNTARYRLHLYHTAPSAIADNSPLTLLWANRSYRFGAIDLAAAGTEGSGSDAANSLNAETRLAFICHTDTRDLFGVLETLDAFTPASGQQFFVELTAETN